MNLKKPSMRDLATLQGGRAFFDSNTVNTRAVMNTFAPKLVIPEIPKDDSKMMFGKKKPELKSEQIRLVENLESRMVHDLEGISQYEELNLAFIYNDLMPGDVLAPISLKRVKEFLENVVKPASESGYNKVMAYYNVLAEDIPKNKLEKLRNAAQSFLGTFRTIENAMQYSQGFYEAAVRMAPKLDAPEEMSLVDRVKWLRLWVFIIRDQTLFWGDMDTKGNLFGKAHLASFNQLHIYPETVMYAEREYFSKLPDNSILYDMMVRMINLFPQDVQNTVLRYGEIGTNVADSSGKIEHVRNLIKKKMFPHPWLAQSPYFCMPIGIKTFVPERLKSAVEAFKNGGLETLPTFEYTYVDAYNEFKRRKMICYQYATAMVEGEERKVGVTCKEELAMYAELYKWLLEHPDFKFGPEEKTLEEYGLDKLLEEAVDPNFGISTWILDMGFAKEEEDINWELVEAVLKPEENVELFQNYLEGTISEGEIFEKFRFSSPNQAIACFSKVSKVPVQEIDKLGQALKRLKTFGVNSALPSDLIYLEIFKYLANNNPEMLGKGLITMYGPKFCQQ